MQFTRHFGAVFAPLFFVAALLVPQPARAQVNLNANIQKCTSGVTDLVMEGCTNLIRQKGSVHPEVWHIAHALRALAWKDRGDREKELADHNVALGWLKKPYERSEALGNRAGAYASLGMLDKAQADINEGLKIAPQDRPKVFAVLHINQGLIYRMQGEGELALRQYEVAISLTPEDPLPLVNRAIVFAELGRYKEALLDLNRAIQVNPKFDLAFAGRSFVFRLRGDLDAALIDADEAIRLNQKSPINFIVRGEMWRYAGDYKKSVADFDKALSLSPDLVRAVTGRALAFEKSGDIARARQEYIRAIGLPHDGAFGESAEAKETASARLAALDSGVPLPEIVPVPRKTEENKLPTPNVVVPAKVEPQHLQGRRVALVIGNSSYKNVGALPNPQRDAEKIAATLKNIGFEVVSLAADADREKLTHALREFANIAEGADWAVVYYAGHGIEVNGTNYLISIDAKLAVDRDVQYETIPLDQVMTAVEGAKKLRLILLDACRDNPFAPQMRKTESPERQASTAGGKVGSRSVGRGLSEVKVSGASLVVYAAKHGQVAMDGEGENSPFAVAVVQRLATPGVEINKIFRLVRDDVMEATAGRQEPYTYGSLPGREDFYFVAK